MPVSSLKDMCSVMISQNYPARQIPHLPITNHLSQSLLNTMLEDVIANLQRASPDDKDRLNDWKELLMTRELTPGELGMLKFSLRVSNHKYQEFRAGPGRDSIIDLLVSRAGMNLRPGGVRFSRRCGDLQCYYCL